MTKAAQELCDRTKSSGSIHARLSGQNARSLGFIENPAREGLPSPLSLIIVQHERFPSNPRRTATK
jgi:hypothetical protein